MPKFKAKSNGKCSWREEDMKEALKKLLSQEMSVREAAQSFRVLKILLQ